MFDAFLILKIYGINIHLLFLKDLYILYKYVYADGIPYADRILNT